MILCLLAGCANPIPCPKDLGVAPGSGLFVVVRFKFVDETEKCDIYRKEFWVIEEENE